MLQLNKGLELYMVAIPFDTLAFANRLKSAGVLSEHAEAQAEAIAEVISTMTNETLATKQDIYLLKQEINELRLEMKQLETRLTIRMGTMLSTGVGILATLMVALHLH